MSSANLSRSERVAARRRELLSIVIQEYVRTAQPVSSKSIAARYTLGVSSATIRNDLAALEDEGLLTHPHTSAGRVPTDVGYRHFVQQLLNDSAGVESVLPRSEQLAIREQFAEVHHEIERSLRLSVAVLARTSRGAALATTPRAAHSRFKHVELVAIHGTKVLLVLVLQEGRVKQQVLDLDAQIEQQELSHISNELNDRLAAADWQRIMRQQAALSPFAQQIATLIGETMKRLDSQADDVIYRDGLMQVLESPEFFDASNARQIVQIFEQRSLLESVLRRSDERDVQVLIAGDGRFEELGDVSLVVAEYGVVDHATGVLGVVGPLRMPYGRTIGAVRFVASLMSQLVRETYGLPEQSER